ncbi:MAG: Fe-S cluster assembly protein SufD [Verrucomicrobiae bacterium]|nr:Fe-S cluster assembly protein SufD [Verrucomicrobiae bacterium]
MNRDLESVKRGAFESPHLRTMREAFDRLALSGVFADDPPWLVSARKRALGEFLEAGYPTTNDEAWRHTSLEKLLLQPFVVAARPGLDAGLKRLIECSAFGAVGGTRLVFANGYFAEGLSQGRREGDDVYVSRLYAAVRERPEIVNARCAAESQPIQYDGRLSLLNLAFAHDGAVVVVPPNTVVQEPITVVFVSLPEVQGETVHVRNLVVVGPQSSVTIVEHCVGLRDVFGVTNTVTDLIVGEGARVEYLKLLEEQPSRYHFGILRVELASSADATCHSFALGAEVNRQNIFAELTGRGVSAVFNGLYLGCGESLVDHYLCIDHAEGFCTSNEYFNGILTGRSKGVFCGRIRVRPGAQKTSAKQTNKNLLLSEQARVYTRPQLEIYADDVRCTHGATVGQLDRDALFYMRSRGLGEGTARRMLIHGFVEEIIERVLCDPARNAIDRLVWNRIDQCEQGASAE